MNVARDPWPVTRKDRLFWSIFLLVGSLVTGHGPLLVSAEPDAWVLPGVGARPGGMGGAFIGLSDDIESVYFNPAGLGNLDHSGVTAMYEPPELDTSKSFLAFNQRWSSSKMPGSVGFGWLH